MNLNIITTVASLLSGTITSKIIAKVILKQLADEISRASFAEKLIMELGSELIGYTVGEKCSELVTKRIKETEEILASVKNKIQK